VSKEGISILGSIAYSLITIMPSLLTEEITANKGVKRKFLLKVLLIASLILILPLGRRPLVFAVIMTLLWSPQLLLSLSKLRVLLLTMSIGTGVVVSNYIFISLRLLSYQDNNGSIIDRLLAVKPFLMSGGIKNVNEYLSEHNASRSFILNFFSDLVEGVLQRPPLFGVETLESLKVMIPRFFGINKYQGNIENISQARFGLRFIDEANSILTTGISDFGFLGVYIMPFLVMIIYQSYCMFILRNKLIHHFAKRILTFLLIYQVLNIESALSSYLVLIRDSLLIVIIYSIFAITFMNLPRTSGYSTKS
jgi:hypothetical protein